MPDKRKAAMAAPSSKRARISYDDEGGEKSSVTPHEKPYSHPIYGQKNAFPGLDDVSEELCYDDAEDDGLGYLRMVRYVSILLIAFCLLNITKCTPVPYPLICSIQNIT